MSPPSMVPVLSTAISVPAMFWQRVEINGSRCAIWIKRDGQYDRLTWDQVAVDVSRFAAKLMSLGINPGDRVAQWCDNSYEWVLADLSIQSIGAIHVPIHAPLTAQQCLEQVAHSGAKLVLVEGSAQLEKLKSLPRSTWDQYAWRSYRASGKLATDLNCPLLLDSNDQPRSLFELRSRAEEIEPSAVATILYTSGTSGEPKGVVLSQGNLMSNVDGVMRAFDDNDTDVRLGFLPLSHVFARTCDLYAWLACGSEFALAESRATVMEDMRTVSPTLINGVPYFYERVYQRLMESGNAQQHGILRATLGGRIRGCCSGGAPLPNHIYDYFVSQDVPLLQGYGMTESSPVITVSTAQSVRRGCVGRALPGVEVVIADDGEILTRGPHVMQGYWNNTSATDAVLRDGWLHTGDLGELDSDGFLRITGRKKEMIVLSNGKKVAPTLIESLLCRDPLIEQAVVAGESQRELVALIVPSAEALKEFIRKNRLWVWSKRRAVTHPKVRAMYRERIAVQLTELSRHEQIHEFEILDHGFTLESGHVTPKGTLRRDRIYSEYQLNLQKLQRTKRTKGTKGT